MKDGGSGIAIRTDPNCAFNPSTQDGLELTPQPSQPTGKIDRNNHLEQKPSQQCATTPSRAHSRLTAPCCLNIPTTDLSSSIARGLRSQAYNNGRRDIIDLLNTLHQRPRLDTSPAAKGSAYSLSPLQAYWRRVSPMILQCRESVAPTARPLV